MIMPHLTRFKLRNNNVQSLVLMYWKKCYFHVLFILKVFKKLWLKLIGFYDNVTQLVEAV